MWQKTFEKYRSRGFTVVGLALDAEGIAPAKMYYEKFGVTFPSLVDPNYATGFGAVPKTFFIDEHGVVQKLDHWEQRLNGPDDLKPVTGKIRRQWTTSGKRLDPASIAKLVREHESQPENLTTAVELASRYLELQLTTEAADVLRSAVKKYQPVKVARAKNGQQTKLLGQAYFQLSRAVVGNRNDQVKYATLSYYLNPSVGYGKQIARIIAPEKFDNRPGGDFDNRFREATLRRLRRERDVWLKGE